MIGKTVSHYSITAQLGEGGMGVVYESLDTKLDRRVALKFLPPELTGDPDAKQRFIREAKSASALKHNHVCTIHDIDETPDGRLFICMDLYEGGSLKERIEEGAMSVADSLRFATQVADGLSAAHDAGIVHRDIKPANILLTRTGDGKIADFGLAKLSGQTKLTKTGTTVGTAGYMSPEQVQGQEAGPQSDVWSVGVMLYQMVTGKLPFTGDHDAALGYNIVNTAPVPLSVHRSDVPVGVQEIIDRCLAKNPVERYRNGGELREALEEIKSEIIINGRRARRGSEAARKRNAGRTIAVVAFLFVIAAALIYKFYPQPSAVEQAIAVVDFQDLSGGEDPTLAAGITSLVNVGLIENTLMRVVSTSYLHDLRRRLFKDSEGNISRDQALEVARRSGATIALIGEVSVAGDDHLVIWQLVDTKDGRAVGGKTARGGDVLVCADAVVVAVLPFLDRISVADVQPAARSVRDVSTASPEAYKHFIAGVLHFEQYQAADARNELERAVALDSTFALAYVYLSKAHYGAITGATADMALARRCADAAWRYRSRLSVKERQRLEAHRLWIDGRNQEAFERYDQFIQRWPDDQETLEEYLSNLHYRWNFEKASMIATNALALYPDNKLFLIVLNAGQQTLNQDEQALETARIGVLRHGDDSNFWHTLGWVYLEAGRPDSAEVAFKKALTIDPRSVWLLKGLAAISYYRGDIGYAIAKNDTILSGFDLSVRDRIDLLAGYNDVSTAIYFAELGQCGRALELVGLLWGITGRNLGLKKWLAYAQCRMLMRSGKYKETLDFAKAIQDTFAMHGDRRAKEFVWFRARALIALGDLRSARTALESIDVISGKDRAFIAGISAELALADNRPGDAIETFLEYKRLGGWGPHWAELEGRTNLARALHGAGRSDEAIAGLEDLLRIFQGHALAHYELGRIYEDLGRSGEAERAYAAFLEMWSEADENMPQLIDARARLARLETAY